MSVDQVISLCASIGSCLAGVGALWTVFQIKKQREASYRPELVVLNVQFEGSAVEENEFPIIWKAISKKEELQIKKQKIISGFEDVLHIPICNIGLGAAKDVSVKWSFPDIKLFVKEVNKLARNKMPEAFFELDQNDWLCSLNAQTCPVEQESEKTHYILPLSTQQELIMLSVPRTYAHLISAFIFLSAKDDIKRIDDLPPLHVTLEYFDIGNIKRKNKLKIRPKIVGLCGTSRFLACLEIT